MNNTTKIIIGAVLIIIIAGFGGYRYGQSSVAGGRQNFGASGPQGNFARRGVSGAGVGMVAGNIIKKDSQSLTIELRTGGSKIIWFASSTEISKMAAGSSADLSIGQTVTVNGATNADGSVVAKTIQLRPVGARPAPMN